MPLDLFGDNATIDTVIRARRKDALTISALETGKLDGRVRTGFRAVPTGHADLRQGDALGDIVISGSYRYTLVSVGGTPVWDRQSLNVGW